MKGRGKGRRSNDTLKGSKWKNIKGATSGGENNRNRGGGEVFWEKNEYMPLRAEKKGHNVKDQVCS